MNRDLAIPNRLNTSIVKRSLSDHLVPSNPGKNLGPEYPIDATEDQDSNTNNREDIVWVPICVPIAIRRDEGHECEEDIGKKVKDRDREVCVPRRCPIFGLAPVKIN